MNDEELVTLVNQMNEFYTKFINKLVKVNTPIPISAAQDFIEFEKRFDELKELVGIT